MFGVLSLLLSWWGIGIGTLLIGAAIGITVYFGLPQKARFWLIVALAAFLYTGFIYQAGERHYRQQVKREVAAEVAKREAAFKAVFAESIRQDTQNQKELFELQAEADRLKKSLVAAAACVATKEEEKRFAPLFPSR